MAVFQELERLQAAYNAWQWQRGVTPFSSHTALVAGVCGYLAIVFSIKVWFHGFMVIGFAYDHTHTHVDDVIPTNLRLTTTAGSCEETCTHTHMDYCTAQPQPLRGVRSHVSWVCMGVAAGVLLACIGVGFHTTHMYTHTIAPFSSHR